MDTAEIRDFSELVTDLRHGNCHQELSMAYQEATEAAKRTGKSASITFTVKIKPCGDRQCEVTDDIKTKIPKPTKQPTIMFVDDHNNLTRTDRKQMKITDVREVAESNVSPQEIVTVNSKTGEVISVQ